MLLFHDLLEAKTTEEDWQSFFDAYPFVFSESLSVKFEGIYRQVPLISGIPDYVFHSATGDPLRGDYGVIELKRPQHSLIGKYSSKIVYPSSYLRVAEQEVTQHLESIRKGQFLNTSDFFIAGSRKHAFIIIGMTQEIANKCKDEFLKAQYLEFLPPHLRIYTYDELFTLFSADSPPFLHMLYMSQAGVKKSSTGLTLQIKKNISVDIKECLEIIKTSTFFSSDITIEKNGTSVDAKNIMGLYVTLASISPGETINIQACGSDSQTAVDSLGELFNGNFFKDKEPPNLHPVVLNRYWPYKSEEEKAKAEEESALRSREYEARRRKRMELEAYRCAERDWFRKSPEVYWSQGQIENEVYEHIQGTAYLISERDQFRRDPIDYWLEAEAEVDPLFPVINIIGALVECPKCGVQFDISDCRLWNGKRHLSCRARLQLVS